MEADLSKPTTIAEAEAFMLAALPMFSRTGAAALKPGLDNIIRMCAALGHPEQQFKSIHIGGTNGKGSTSHTLAAILQAAGYKVGLHTSPHLKKFNERIRINGKPIEDQQIVNFITDHWDLWQTVKPSFFEYGVLLAFHTFAQEKVDVAIIEVGLGGRLDSTNVILPILSVITNISFDHTDLLGNTIAAIATEKAGIIKKSTPVVVGEFEEASASVFRQSAKTAQTDLYFAQDFYAATKNDGEDSHYQIICKQGTGIQSGTVEFGLSGDYQAKNLATILTATTQLNKLGWHITDQAIRTGLSQVVSLTGLKGRWQTLQKAPLAICDTGHNEAGINFIVQQLEKTLHHLGPESRLHFIIGMVADKDISKVLSLLPKHASYYFCNANIPRALPAAILAEKASGYGLSGLTIPDVNDAYATALKNAHSQDLVFIGGSTYTVAELNCL